MNRVTVIPLLFLVALAAFAVSVQAQNARIQVIHNAPDPATDTVDVYLGEDLLVDDFAFRTATPFMDTPADVEIVFGFAPSSSASGDDVIATFPMTLQTDETYVLVASGVLDPSMFAPNPDGRDTEFTLLVKEGARETAADPAMVDAFGIHGAPDAPSFDVIVGDNGAKFLDDFGYGDITDYESFPEDTVFLTVTPPDNEASLATVEVDLTGLGGIAGVVLASGFANPDLNMQGPSLAALIVFPDGTVVVEPLQLIPPEDDEVAGCTRSKGFWKNHPDAWPQDIAPEDEFLESGITWMDVLWTPPKGGNAFFILGSQYAAAVLNVASGADVAEIADSLSRAEELLSATFPEDPPAGEVRSEFIEIAEVLDAYNNGRVGPEHCKDGDNGDDGDGGDGGDDADLGVAGVGTQRSGETPERITLKSAYPNPFNPVTRIEFGMPIADEARLSVFDALGRRVQVLLNEALPAGTYTIAFRGDGLPSGTYFYRLKTGVETITKSVVLLK